MHRSQQKLWMRRNKSDITKTSAIPENSRRYLSKCTDDIHNCSEPVIVHTTPPISHSYSSLTRQQPNRLNVSTTLSKPKSFTPLICHKSYKPAQSLVPRVNTMVRYCQEGTREKESNVWKYWYFCDKRLLLVHAI